VCVCESVFVKASTVTHTRIIKRFTNITTDQKSWRKAAELLKYRYTYVSKIYLSLYRDISIKEKYVI